VDFDYFYFNNCPEPLLILDLEGNVVKFNEKFRKIVDFEIKEGYSLKESNFKNPDNKYIFESPFFESYFEFEFENREIHFDRDDGFVLNFLCSYKRIQIEEKEYLYISFKNITDLVSFKKIFEELYDSLSAKTIELDNVIMEKEKAYKLLKQKDDEMLRQLYIAHEIQEGIFPDINKNINSYSIHSLAKPASIVSGDVLSVWDNEDEYLDIVIADVTGHGVPSAFITMMLKMSLQTRREEIKTPEAIVNAINNDMYPILAKATIFVTLLFARLYYESGRIEIIDCGHTPPVLIKNNGDIKTIEINGMMLGITEELDAGKLSFILDKGDIIFFMTDGIVEAQNQDGKFFEDIYFDILKNIKEEPVNEIINTIFKEIYKFTQTEELRDDTTILGIKRN